MVNEKPQPDNNIVRDMAVRTQALDMAIRANCGLVYTDDGKQSYSEIEIVKAASMFEEFIKGNSTKKEGW